ncbi:MAG: hypothetical protein VX672_05235, partial [Planctomycetota bacterium]|nr:hypothetical protein [Planctomycetota bacterium]
MIAGAGGSVVDGGNRHLEEWSTLAEALADGRTDRETRDRFWCLLETRVRGLLLQGPANDPDACRVRPRFQGILPDVHAAEDFASEFLGGLLRRFDEGCFHLEELRGTTPAEGLGRIAAGSLVRMRAITFARHLAGAGVTERPAESGGVGSLDAGEDGGRAASLSAPEVGEDSTPRLLAAAAEDRPVIRLDLRHVSAAAIVATAGLQLHPLLDPQGA